MIVTNTGRDQIQKLKYYPQKQVVTELNLILLEVPN